MLRIQWEPKPQVEWEALDGVEVTPAMARKTGVDEMSAEQLRILMKVPIDERYYNHPYGSELSAIVASYGDGRLPGIRSSYDDLESDGYIRDVRVGYGSDEPTKGSPTYIHYYITEPGRRALDAVRGYVSRPRYQKAWMTVSSWCKHDILTRTIATAVIAAIVGGIAGYLLALFTLVTNGSFVAR